MSSFFGLGTKENKSTTNNTTNNAYTDQSANAGGDNSLAVGQGASLSINTQDLSEGVAKEAIKSGVDQTALATDVAKTAIAANSANTAFTVNTLAGIQETAGRETKDANNLADIALRNSNGLTSQLQEITAAALGRAQAPEATSIATISKPLIIGLVAVVALIFFFTRNRQSK